LESSVEIADPQEEACHPYHSLLWWCSARNRVRDVRQA
jgi:hypothetical protein